MATYPRLDPDAPTDRLEASSIVSTMIANAIRADTRWFRHGPDASLSKGSTYRHVFRNWAPTGIPETGRCSI